ncbi:MAG: hypothetical protein Q4D48_04760 [Coriobacteriales bacterium]|nr:hypothetical protein [Coriobacteriales bacterium]
MPDDEKLDVTTEDAVAEAEEVFEETTETAADEVVEETAEAAEDAVAEQPAVVEQPAPAPAPARQLSQKAWIALCCAALVIGLVLGKFVLGGSSAKMGSFAGRTSITEAELDQPVATLVYKGTKETITSREIILQTSSLEASKDEEGNYCLPSADSILSVARNRIIDREAESRGLTATDEEIAAFAKDNLGSSDYASIGQAYGLDEASVIEILRSSASMQKLRAEVVGTETPVMPQAPAELAEGADATAQTAEYADYIISLVGDEWDATAGKWAAPDGPYAVALANYEISAKGASYEAAYAAYYVAYQQYTEQASAASTAWTNYVNTLLANASITISTLTA